MAHRMHNANSARTNINSVYFLRQAADTTDNKIDEQSIIIKGNKNMTSDASNTSEPSGAYEHIGGEDDVFIVENDGNSFKLHRKTLKENLLELKKFSHSNVRQLTAEHTESFRSVVEAMSLLHGTQALYDILLTDIRAIFSSIKDVKPGSVAAYFVGCFTDDKFSGPQGCSPKCASSLPPADGTPGYSNCEDLVLIYSEDGTFSSLNEKRSTHAYIYVESVEFAGFTKENIIQLRDAGIENSSIIFGNKDGSYREITSAMAIKQLPQQSGGKVSTQSSDSNVGGVIVLSIIVAIIIFLIFVFLYRNRRA